MDDCHGGRAARPERNARLALAWIFGKGGGYSRYVVWQEGPVAAILNAVARPWLSESPGRADAFGPAVGSTEVESRCGTTLVAADTKCKAKIELVSIGHGDALGCCKGTGGIGLALRLGVGNLRSKEPLDLGFAVAEAAAVGGVLTYGTVPIAVDGDLLRAVRVPLCVSVSCCLFKSVLITYYEFLIGNRIDAS